MATPQITVYGADWCGDTSMTRNQLKKMGVPFQYVNVDKVPEGAEWVREHNGGKQKLPTVDVGGKVLSMPEEAELAAAVRAAGR
jgi:mycoredoxin